MHIRTLKKGIKMAKPVHIPFWFVCNCDLHCFLFAGKQLLNCQAVLRTVLLKLSKIVWSSYNHTWLIGPSTRNSISNSNVKLYSSVRRIVYSLSRLAV